MNDHGHNFLSVKPPLPSDTNSDICRPTTDVASYAAASNNPHVAAATAEVWHRRLGHPGPMITQNFKKNVLGVIVEGKLPDAISAWFGNTPFEHPFSHNTPPSHIPSWSWPQHSLNLGMQPPSFRCLSPAWYSYDQSRSKFIPII